MIISWWVVRDLQEWLTEIIMYSTWKSVLKIPLSYYLLLRHPSINMLNVNLYVNRSNVCHNMWSISTCFLDSYKFWIRWYCAAACWQFSSPSPLSAMFKCSIPYILLCTSHCDCKGSLTLLPMWKGYLQRHIHLHQIVIETPKSREAVKKGACAQYEFNFIVFSPSFKRDW